MVELHLIVNIAGHRVAIGAEQLASVIEVDSITPVPRVAPHVAGLFALRSRVLTVIDSHVALGNPPMPRTDLMSAVVVTTDDHGYALLVDEVEDVITDATISPCAAVLGDHWSRIALGQLSSPSLSDGAVLLVDPALLIAPPEARAA